MFEGIYDALHRELSMMDDKLSTAKSEINSQELDHIDKMAHALKSLKSYEVMLDGCEPKRRRYDYDYRRY